LGICGEKRKPEGGGAKYGVGLGDPVKKADAKKGGRATRNPFRLKVTVGKTRKGLGNRGRE